ncbi:MAG: hypothetical protein IIX84_08345 [Oscillospiraceae bacterium]|nr:hypothetical protein [Oscillospiraceae bacterium]
MDITKFESILSPTTKKFISKIYENDLSSKLLAAGEPYAAAVALPDDVYSPLLRHSLAYTMFFMEANLTPYDGGKLYPCGGCLLKNGLNIVGMQPEFSFTYTEDPDILEEKVPGAKAWADRERLKTKWLDTPHTIGGAGYTHSFINYRRILADGYLGYRARIDALPECDFKDSMTVLMDGIFCYHARCLELLRASNAPSELIEALEYVPAHSPRNIYEAIVAWNFAYYVDGCDDPGGMDRGLLPYWKGEDIVDLLREFFRHVDVNFGWSMPLGPNHNGLTVQLIKAIHNIRRPQMQLLVTKDMPQEVWEAAYEALATSCGQPALYNWDAYREEMKLRTPQVSDEDLLYIAFGGCTETMIEGLSNVGSDDAGVNAALVFDGFFRDRIGEFDDFDSFLEGFLKETDVAIADVCHQLQEYRITRGKHRPQPIRTMFIDDCIDTMTEFNAGGARYNWGVINVAGLINVIDSMVVIKRFVYDEKRYSWEEFIRLLDARDPEFLALCAACPKHGNDDPTANDIASRLSDHIFGEFENYDCPPDGKYYAVSNQFTTYEYAGFGVRATPDGRADGEPLNDSCGAVAGRDKKGPTALLNSVACLNLRKVLGTPITNIRISKKNLPLVLKPLTEAFFQRDGMQLQITCASKEELLDAVAHPEKYESLVVRIGGFSEYFNVLSPTLKQSVIDRTEY